MQIKSYVLLLANQQTRPLLIFLCVCVSDTDSEREQEEGIELINALPTPLIMT